MYELNIKIKYREDVHDFLNELCPLIEKYKLRVVALNLATLEAIARGVKV